MAIEVLKSITPPRRYRALLGTTALLAFATALAGAATRRRGEPVMGPVLVPQGFGISFQVPRGFVPGPPVLHRPATALPFFGTVAGGNQVTLILWKIADGGADDPSAICEFVLQQHAQPTDGGGTVGGCHEEGTLGRWVASEGRSTGLETVVRASSLPIGVSYAVSLSVSEGTVSESVQTLFDRTCATLRFHRSGR